MKKMFSLVIAITLLLGIASQASAAYGGVYVFNPYPNSYGAVPDYIGITKPSGAYQYKIRILEKNNGIYGSLTYDSGRLDVPSSGYDIHHTLSSSTKLMLLHAGTFVIIAEAYNGSGTLIGMDEVKVTFV
jgi:hypothetical protein